MTGFPGNKREVAFKKWVTMRGLELERYNSTFKVPDNSNSFYVAPGIVDNS
jgi:hypothetical protein